MRLVKGQKGEGDGKGETPPLHENHPRPLGETGTPTAELERERTEDEKI